MKKGQKVLSIFILIIVVLGIIFFTVDYSRAKSGEKPIFCIKNPAGVYLDGGSVEYFGLGYKVIDFNTIAGFNDIKIGTWFMNYEDFDTERKLYEKLYEIQLGEQTDDSQTFYAKIKKINDRNILVEGLPVNDINYRGEFDFSIKESTILLWRGTKIDVSDLDVGDNISITFKGGILERYPAGITNVTKIQLLDDEK